MLGAINRLRRMAGHEHAGLRQELSDHAWSDAGDVPLDREQIIAMLRAYDVKGDGMSSGRTTPVRKASQDPASALLPTEPRPPAEGEPASSSPRRRKARSGDALARLLDASLPQVAFLPEEPRKGGPAALEAPVLPRKIAPDRSQLAARQKHLLRLQAQYEAHAKGIANAPASDPNRMAVLQQAYPNDDHETIEVMVRYLQALGTYRRAAEEQRVRDADAALLHALDANGDGVVSYKEFMGLAKATGLEPKRMRAKFVRRDVANRGELRMSDMEEILVELRQEATRAQLEGQKKSSEEAALQKYAQATNPMAKLVTGLV